MLSLAAPLLFVALAGCSGDDASENADSASYPIYPDASCPVVIDKPKLKSGEHVPEGTTIAFETNPPSSGAHYPVWANFQEFPTAVPRGYWLHSAEHGAVVLLYKCSGADCAPIQEGLRQVAQSIATDPLCDPAIRARVVITPDPELDVPVAAVTWGFTYKAQCLDLPTLTAFAKEHYNRATENTCSPGRTSFDPSPGLGDAGFGSADAGDAGL